MKKYSLNNGYVGSDQRQSIRGTTGIVKNFIQRKALQLGKSIGLNGNVKYDPKSAFSYPGTGTTVNSLGDLAYNATLVNGVAFNANEYFEFDGVNDYIIADEAASLFNQNQMTIEMVLLPIVDGFSGGAGGRVIWSTHDTAYGNRYIFTVTPNTGQIGKLGAQGLTSNNAAGTLGGEWKVVHFTKDVTAWDIYVDGIYNTSTTIENYANSGRVSFGQEWDGSNSSDHYLGDMGSIHIFNRKLSAQEIVARANAALAQYT